MKRICLGTMITLIYQSRIRRSDTYKSVCGGIFAAYGLKIDNYNKELPSHLRSGHDPAPEELVSAARTMSMDDIDKGVEEYVLPLINHEKEVAFFRAIKAVLREDSFTDGALIGRIKGYEKVNILNCNSYYESMLLANVLTYAIASIDNDVCSSNIAEIGKEFVDSFLTSGEEIHFISKLINQDEVCPLKRTLKSPAFDRLFLKATDVTITGMTNPARACVYYLDPMNCQFRFRDLKSFISSNIGSYVFSRADKNRIVEFQGTEQAVGSQAILKFMQRYGADAETVLGEILLYIFLEQELDAPKIMTKIELEETRGVVSKSDGVHLLSLNLSGQPIHQLVFGASDIVGDLSAAIDRAFNKIVKIEANADEELRMVENTAQWTIYDPETTKYMVELMRPHKGGKSTPEMAFGAFLGYTIKIDPPETDSQKYKKAVREQLIRDIKAVQPHISDLILKHGLSGYSFYFYVLPFNDAPTEKVSIIKDMLSGGVN